MRDLLRPEPVLHHRARPVDRDTPPRWAAQRLLDGEDLIVTDFYKTGAEILSNLKTMLRPPPAGASYEERQDFKRRAREASLCLLAPIRDNCLDLQDARTIGFIEELYPGMRSFTLPFIRVQELYGAWTLYRDGVYMAVLGRKVHPYFGTYAPTRTVHLELFATWLSQYGGARTRAIDVGTGCGVLAMMLGKARFEQVFATDDNPNAIESVARELRRDQDLWPIELSVCDLLGEDGPPMDLIVFNPPWTQGQPESLVDRALLYEDGLFERFFEQASGRLTPEGRVVLLFSNIQQLVQPDEPHPIEAELARGRFRLVQKLRRKVKPVPDAEGRVRRTKERVEVWELARI
jgi:hypothetical protein